METKPEAASGKAGRPRVILIGASYTTGNMGVDALLSGSIASVFHSYPDAEVVVLDYGREPRVFPVPVGDRTIPVRMENIRFSKRIFLGNHIGLLLGLALLARLIPVRGFREWLLARNRTLRIVREADVVCSLAGGDSFSDIYGLRRLIYVSLPQFLALALGRPLVLLPQTLGPFHSRTARWIGRRIMNRASIVFTRDRVGMEEAAKLLGASRGAVRFSRDMAFALDSTAPVGGVPAWLMERGDRPLIGLNVSGLLYMGGYSQNNMFGLKVDYRKLIDAIITRFVVGERAHVMLVAHVTGTVGGEGDGAACSHVYEALKDRCEGRLHWLGEHYNHREIKHLIGHCDFFLGSRMHACIAALSQGIPAVGLAYSRKFAGVFESIRAGQLVVDLRSLDQSAALDSIFMAYEERHALGGHLQSEARSARQQALCLLGSVDPAIRSAMPAS